MLWLPGLGVRVRVRVIGFGGWIVAAQKVSCLGLRLKAREVQLGGEG